MSGHPSPLIASRPTTAARASAHDSASSRTVPGLFAVMGTASSRAAVVAWGSDGVAGAALGQHPVQADEEEQETQTGRHRGDAEGHDGGEQRGAEEGCVHGGHAKRVLAVELGVGLALSALEVVLL